MLANPSRATCTSYPPRARGLARRARGGGARVVEVALLQLPTPLLVERGERVVQDALPDLAHQPVVEVQVVLPQQLPAQRLVRLRQVVEIGARVVPAGRAGAGRVEGLVRMLVDTPAELEVPPRGEHPAALAEGRRQDAVEHVDTAVHGLEQIEGRAHAHEVAGAVLGHPLGGLLAHVLPLVTALAHRQASDGEAVEGHGRQAQDALAAQVREERPLHDAEERLGRITPRVEAACRPTVREVQGRPRRGAVGHGAHTVVEHHHDVAADGHLRLDGELGAQPHRPPVDVALEEGPLLGHLTRVGQREDLVAARVGQHRAGPAHEPVNAAHPPKDLRPRAEQEVVGVGEKDLRPGRDERLRRLRPHRGLRPHRHEEGRLDGTVKRLERRGPRLRAAGLRVDAEVEPGGSHAP